MVWSAGLPWPYKYNFEGYIKIPDLFTLAAMKAFALGRRAKWKDYVDLYFIIKKYGGYRPVLDRAGEIFKKLFNEKLFRMQLSYFDDINYSEKIVYLKGFRTAEKEIKARLVEASLE